MGGTKQHDKAPAQEVGWKTSEFWMTLLAQAVSATAASGAVTSSTLVQALGVAGTVLSQLGYTASRAAVKRGKSLAEVSAKGGAYEIKSQVKHGVGP